MASTRPLGVTIVAIIVLANGVISTIGAIILLVTGSTLAGIIGLILGILTLGVAAGLFARSQIARLLTTIVLVLQIAAAIFNIGQLGAQLAVTWPIISGVLSLAALILLYTKQANAYFR